MCQYPPAHGGGLIKGVWMPLAIREVSTVSMRLSEARHPIGHHRQLKLQEAATPSPPNRSESSRVLQPPSNMEYLPWDSPDVPKYECTQLETPSIPAFVISVFLVVGILVSYLPQHLRIILRRSSEGLSPYFVLLGTTSSTFAIFNILTLPRSQHDIACCREISHFACLAGLLGIAQVAVQWGCFSLMYELPCSNTPRVFANPAAVECSSSSFSSPSPAPSLIPPTHRLVLHGAPLSALC